MKIFKAIVYILGIVGLTIALFCIAPVIKQFSNTHLMSALPPNVLAGLIYLIFYGLVFYYANKGLCKLLEDKTAVISAFIVSLILDGIYLAYYANAVGSVYVAINIYTLFAPLYGRYHKIRHVYCSFCGKLNSMTSKYCTDCGKELIKDKE